MSYLEVISPTCTLPVIPGGSFFNFPFRAIGESYCPGSISILIGWFGECIIVLVLLLTVATCGSVPAVISIKAFYSQEERSKWTQNTAQTSGPSVFGWYQTESSAKTSRAEMWESVDCLVGRVQMEVMRDRLWSAESTEHGGVDLSIQSLAVSGSYSLPLLKDAVCFSLCLTLPQKTNVGNRCAPSLTALCRLPHGWAASC